MPQIVYDGDEPFRFGYGGRSYIVPPKQGGRWEIVYELSLIHISEPTRPY